MTTAIPARSALTLSLIAGAACAATSSAEELLYEQQIDGYTQFKSHTYPGDLFVTEAADDFIVSGTIERVRIYGGNCCLGDCFQPAGITQVVLRFYTADNDTPGQLVQEYVLSGDDPAFAWNKFSPGLLDITLTPAFEADGQYFISAQPTFDSNFCWSWRSANRNHPVSSIVQQRVNGGPWQPIPDPLGGDYQNDLAFALFGTPDEPAPDPIFVDDDCHSDWLALDVLDLQPGEAGIPDPVANYTNSLENVVVLEDSTAWAVGSFGYTPAFNPGHRFSLTMFFDGTQWNYVPAPSPHNSLGLARASLEGVDAVSATEMYACGNTDEDGITRFFILHWDGSEWEQLFGSALDLPDNETALLHDVDVLNADSVWFAGGGEVGPSRPQGVVIHYDGSNFERFDLPLVGNAAHRLRAISALAPDDVWAAGALGGVAVAIGKSYVVHYDGSSWQHVPTPDLGHGEIIRDIVAIAPDDVWVCGGYDISPPKGGPVIAQPLFMHWNGSAWTQYDSPGYANDLVVLAPDRIYGVSGEQLVFWNGTEWGLVGDLDDDLNHINLRGIDSYDGCNLIAVGSSVGSNKNTRAALYEAQPVDGDLNGDQGVSVQDLLLLLADWGSCATPCPPQCLADLNDDCTVDVLDLLILLANWS